MLVVGELVGRFGPFLIPVVVFGAGLLGYGLLWLYSNRLAGDQ